MLIERWRRAWVVRSEQRRARRAAGKTVAIGFAWPAANIGGVRRHIDAITRQSRFCVYDYPGRVAIRHWPVRARHEYSEVAVRSALHQDLVHSHVEPAFVRAGLRALDLGKPWVHTYHAMYFSEDWGGELQPWQQEINRCLVEEASRASVRLCVSDWFSEHLLTVHGIVTQVIPNGVDVVACDAARGARFVRAFGSDSGILFLSSLSAIKNPGAFVGIARRFPHERFVMAGTELTSGALRKALGDELPANLVALGPLSGSAALDAVAACRVFVMTSHREGLPTALLEAMTLAKPCVVPRAHGCRDALGDERYGFLYEPGNLDDLEAKIRMALGAGSVSAARLRVLQRFSWGVVIPQIDRLYARLLAA